MNLVFVPGFISRVDHVWDEPRWAGFLDRLASFSRLICFDKRGTGLSDRVSNIPTLEERMDDVRTVMDAAGSERAAFFGISEGGPMSVLFAASYPLFSTAVLTPEELAEFEARVDQLWGTGASASNFCAKSCGGYGFPELVGPFRKIGR
jgi:pimeloyl-ACP methyl ester carboxylesterase